MKIILLIYAICGLSILSTPEVAAAPPQSNYKYYFSWENYVVGDPREQALYLWNGEKVGAGKKGFQEILKHLNSIPDKSEVYIFPDMAKWRYEGSAPNPIPNFPFFDYMDDLQHIERVKDLHLIFTTKDEQGHVLKGL